MGQCPCAGESAPPVIEAARADDLEKLKSLVASGEDINQTDEAAWTALHIICASHGHYMRDHGEGELLDLKIDILKFLLAQGANVNAQTRAGATPLHECAFNDFEEGAELLLEANAEVDALNVGGRSALHLSCEQGCLAIALMLLEKGADGNRQDRDGETPFLNAADSCKKALHEYGFKGDMSQTDEAKDKAFLEEEVKEGRLHSDAQKDSMDESRTAARKTDDKEEKSGLLSVKIERTGSGTEVDFYIQKAKYLKDCDAYGNNDVYVVVQIDGPDGPQYQRTSTQKDAGDKPVWEQGRGEKLAFADVPPIFEDIIFRVYDEDYGGDSTDDLIGMHKIPLAKIKSLRGTGEDFVWEADVQLRQNREMEKELPPQTTERYKPAVAVDEAGNEIAAAV